MTEFKPGDVVTVYAYGGREHGVIVRRMGDNSWLVWCDCEVLSVDWFPERGIKLVKNPSRIRNKSTRESVMKKSEYIREREKTNNNCS